MPGIILDTMYAVKPFSNPVFPLPKGSTLLNTLWLKANLSYRADFNQEWCCTQLRSGNSSLLEWQEATHYGRVNMSCLPQTESWFQTPTHRKCSFVLKGLKPSLMSFQKSAVKSYILSLVQLFLELFYWFFPALFSNQKQKLWCVRGRGSLEFIFLRSDYFIGLNIRELLSQYG